MDIIPLGHSSFKIRSKRATIVLDPYSSERVGMKFPKNTDADIITVSHAHEDHNAVFAVSGNPYIVDGPGEYEIKGVAIIGVASYHDANNGIDRGKNTIYHIEVDSLHLAHLGDLGTTLTPSQLEELDGVDILFVPVGGFFTIDAATAIKVIESIEPKIVIPMHYSRTELNPKIFEKLEPVSVFLKQIGKEVAPVPKLSITKDKLPAEMQVVVLE
jgi:L-ascorbate metabolism protein UlaG (beta-lactamase superfamily)